MFVAGAMTGGDVRSATTTVEAGQSDDLRPLYANAGDVAEGKRVAETSCVACHGINGISTTEGVPHIAGQRPAYLWIELRAYKTGARGEKTMGAAAKSILSDEALLKVAAYYASLDPPQPTAASAKPRPEPLQAGKATAAACVGCHGETGISKTAGIPSLAGLDPKYFAAAMKAYSAGQRKNEMMKPIAASLIDADVANVGQFYTVAVGDIAWFNDQPWPGGTGMQTAKITGSHQMTSNTGSLAGNHPVAMPYPYQQTANTYNGTTNGNALIAADWVADPTANNIRLFTDPSGVGTGIYAGTTALKTGLECSSCHEPHNSSAVKDDMFLRGFLTGSGQSSGYLCQQCHIK